MATRHERRKRVRARKDAKAELLMSRALRVLQEERERINLAQRKPKRSPRGLQSSFPRLMGCSAGLKGFGTGAFKPDTVHLNDRGLRAMRDKIAKRG